MTLAKSFIRASFFCGVAFMATSSFAHVELSSPRPRAAGQSEENLKNSPCGQNTNGRTDRVTVFEPGQTITVTFNEFINHPSYYRVAFDPDGDTFPTRSDVPINAVETTAAVQTAEQNLLNGTGTSLLAIVPEVNGTASSATVTLPNIECENCTLQLIEFMYDKAFPSQGYYQCADIALRRAGTVGEGDGSDNGSGADAGAEPGTPESDGGSATAPGSNSSSGVGATSNPRPVSGGEASGGTSTGSVPTTTTNPLQPAPSGSAAPGAPAPVAAQGEGDDDGGCSFGPGSGSRKAGFGALVVMGLGLVGAARRRKQAR